MGKEAAKEESDVLTSIAKYRPHRHECAGLQGFLAVGTLSCYRPQTVGYLPLP
jgi:hypothetical protein